MQCCYKWARSLEKHGFHWPIDVTWGGAELEIGATSVYLVDLMSPVSVCMWASIHQNLECHIDWYKWAWPNIFVPYSRCLCNKVAEVTLTLVAAFLLADLAVSSCWAQKMPEPADCRLRQYLFNWAFMSEFLRTFISSADQCMLSLCSISSFCSSLLQH